MKQVWGLRCQGLTILFYFLCVGELFAHDFWIDPATYRPVPDTRLTVQLQVGDLFNGRPFPHTPGHITQFVLAGPDQTQPVSGWPGRDPAGWVSIQKSGIFVLGYWSTHTVLELEAEKFEAYLKQEGLDHIIRSRAERGETAKPGKEAFFRCAKAILSAGSGGEDGYDRRLGFPFELIPEQNPYQLQSGDELVVQVLYQANPLKGVRVAAINAGDPTVVVEARSDAQGRVKLQLDRPGVWLVKSVHMRPAPEALAADWESAWASLTFSLSGAP